MFTLGEFSFTNPVDSLSHLLQLAPILLLCWLSWSKPLIGGILLIASSLIFGGLYIIDGSQAWQTIVLVELVLFLPVFLSGILFYLSFNKNGSSLSS